MDKDQTTTQGAVSDSAATLADPQIEALAKTLGVPPLPGRTGGPGDSEAPKAEPLDVTEEEVAEALTIYADWKYARTRADHWIITKDEKEMLGRRGKRVLDLFVKIDPAYMAIGTFITGIGIVYGPRIAADKIAIQEAKDQKPESKKEE